MGKLNAAVHRLAAPAFVYDLIQHVTGLEYTRRKLQPHLAQMAGQVVPDVGAGTGLYRSLLPDTAQYLWLDNDPEKLRGFKRKHALMCAMLGDATRIGLKVKSVDYALAVAVAHHPGGAQLLLLISELARIVRHKVIFLDALEHTK